MKLIKRMLVIVGAAALLAGCASENNGSGALGNDSEVGSGSANNPTPAPHRTSANGIISPSNPLGMSGGNSQPVSQ